ncbi:MAG: hypothetical protein ACK4NC_05245 [Candidatus Gracilibacteria bacterium]
MNQFIPRYLRRLATVLLTVFFLIPQAHAVIIFTNEFLSNEGENAVIDSDGNATGSITLKFGQTANQTLTWDITTSKFILSNNLAVNGTLGINGNVFTLDADNVGAASNVSIVANQGVGAAGTIRYNASTLQWEMNNNGGTYYPITTSNTAFIQNGNSFGTNATFGTNDAFPLLFETGGSEAMRISAGGLVGVNTTSLTDRFTVTSAASTASANTSTLNYTQSTNVANITGAGLNIAVTPSGDAGDTIRGINIANVTGTSSTEEGINIGTGFDRDIRFNDANVTIAVPDNVNMSLLDTSGNNMMLINDLSSTGGAYSEIGSVLQRNSYVGEEFMRERADLNADAALAWGDIQAFAIDEANNCVFSVLDDTVNGIGRIALGANNTSCLAYLSSATAGNAHLIFNRSNLPIILMKVKPSNVSANDDLWVGIGDDAAGSANPPANGIFFTNNDGTNWTGVTRSASTSTNVSCGVAVSTSQFALLKIEVVSTTDVRFYIDSDVSDGITWTSCGSSTTNIPSTNLTTMMKINSTTSGRTLDIDFFRAWQF